MLTFFDLIVDPVENVLRFRFGQIVKLLLGPLANIQFTEESGELSCYVCSIHRLSPFFVRSSIID